MEGTHRCDLLLLPPGYYTVVEEGVTCSTCLSSSVITFGDAKIQFFKLSSYRLTMQNFHKRVLLLVQLEFT